MFCNQTETTMTTETIKLTCPIFDNDGNETGSEVIEVTEVGEHKEHAGDGIGYIRTVTHIEISGVSFRSHPDDVIATLDNHYGYFKYQIV